MYEVIYENRLILKNNMKSTVANDVVGDLLLLFPGQLDGLFFAPGAQDVLFNVGVCDRDGAMHGSVYSGDIVHCDNPLNNLFSRWFNYRSGCEASKRSVSAAGGRREVGGCFGSLAVRGGCF